MGKRNQYNRSTFAQDMNITVYNSNATTTRQSGSLGAISVDAGLWFYGGQSEATGTLDISAMGNGQTLTLINGSDSDILLNASVGRFLSPSFATASSTVLPTKKYFVTYKLDSIDLPTGTTSNVMILVQSGTYPGFP